MNKEIPYDDIEQLAKALESAPSGTAAYVIRDGSSIGIYTPDDHAEANQ